MTARVLVVDDILSNVKLLDAKLSAEYFEVITACNGEQALTRVDADLPDIVLLDVMMPGMDGFEVCRRIKANAKTTHIPVVMVTALDQPSDRVTGLDAGADDFLTKPVDDTSLFARVRSLVRLKMMTDELRMREETGQSMGLGDASETMAEPDPTGRILIVEDRPESVAWFRAALEPKNKLADVSAFEEALVQARGGDFDLIVVSLGIRTFDGLRLCSHLRSLGEVRNTPILVLVSEGENRKLAQALDMGVNDYLMRPIDRHELLARVRTQIKRKRHSDFLRHRLAESVELSITDALTGLHNRRYMEGHLRTLVSEAIRTGRKLSMLVADIDHFKNVNDTYGHDVGDAVLKEFAVRLKRNTRGIDLACRLGGEEFVIIMPDTDVARAYQVGERLRACVASDNFPISADQSVRVTASVGIGTLERPDDTPETIFKRADNALYTAKRRGRNRVVADAA